MMKFLIAALLLTLELGGSFIDSSVDGEVVSSGEIEITVSVTVEGGPSTVVMHLVDPGDDQVTVTLGHQGGGVHTGVAIAERADLVVVYEAIWPDGTSETSQPTTLTELGMDPAILLDNPDVTTPEEEGNLTLDAATERWGWAALALGAAALSLLAWWALADYPRKDRTKVEDSTTGD